MKNLIDLLFWMCVFNGVCFFVISYNIMRVKRDIDKLREQIDEKLKKETK